MYVPQTTPQQCHHFLTNICQCIFVYVDLNLLVGVVTFTFSPLHCFYATIVEGGAADRRRRPILVLFRIMTCFERITEHDAYYERVRYLHACV